MQSVVPAVTIYMAKLVVDSQERFRIVPRANIKVAVIDETSVTREDAGDTRAASARVLLRDWKRPKFTFQSVLSTPQQSSIFSRSSSPCGHRSEFSVVYTSAGRYNFNIHPIDGCG